MNKDILNLLAESISKKFINTRVTIGPTLKFNIHRVLTNIEIRSDLKIN